MISPPSSRKEFWSLRAPATWPPNRLACEVDVDCCGMASGCSSSRLVVLRSIVGKARSSSLRTVFPTVESSVCKSAPGVERTSTRSVAFPSFSSILIVVLLPTSTVTDETTACANPPAVAVTE